MAALRRLAVVVTCAVTLAVATAPSFAEWQPNGVRLSVSQPGQATVAPMLELYERDDASPWHGVFKPRRLRLHV